MRALALLRVLAGPVVLLHLRPFLVRRLGRADLPGRLLRALRRLVPGAARAVYVGLLWLAAVAAVAMTLGLLTRLATATTFAIVAYNLFLSTTHFHNNRAYLVIVLGLLAVAPCGRELSVDAWLRRRRGPAAARPLGAGLAAVAAAVRVRRGLRRIRAEQARSIPTGSAAPSPGSGSCGPATSWRRGRCRTGRCRS